MTRHGGPSGVRGASTVIDSDEDKWTEPIWPPCGGEGGVVGLVG